MVCALKAGLAHVSWTTNAKGILAVLPGVILDPVLRALLRKEGYGKDRIYSVHQTEGSTKPEVVGC